MTPEEKRDKYERAKERVADLKKFYGEIMSYFLFMAVLAGINYYFNDWRYMWFLWPAFGWGIGLIFKAYKLFSKSAFFGRDWEERKIKEYIDKEDRYEK
ncbi:histidine kinase [Dokdonia pacifica]|uniref:2TM domain-containing protein n=1 Tax=Dokdonia pacifica TaxID=1627892 RepID=A0A238YNY7_9FLAO|nr:2TM domain-containing protein [Dokdonia pacifica]GGG11198.1 histidine kinase [Dokdonia pacifica]SNR72411.1 2TM domain-containing protein [Dokdonia pacifica]